MAMVDRPSRAGVRAGVGGAAREPRAGPGGVDARCVPSFPKPADRTAF